ncbi:LysE family translocator [Pseudomonas sp. ABC1]|uniref:LysE family translocator n=1 Tax=Pseudomonas sp. ABC1 TaxID=2748080 RepID=UPI0015C32039|nr:LysE family translocator [Pseudomonas sp. ABC1]QLF92628.1 LysE family translocator [Pseudomonas sp. ABC1]
MEQFLMVAAAHFLALLSPGPDFFLVARTSISAGWKVASGACLGIALANGAFILAAFTGTSALSADSVLFVALQLAGCVYLLYLGVLFIRHAGSGTLEGATPVGRAVLPLPPSRAWCRAAGMGFLSGILNPKNALFYTSLAALLGGAGEGGHRLLYGIWMFCVVLFWDLLVACAIGNRVVLRRFAQALPWLERASGVVLILLGGGVLVVLSVG